MEKIRVEILNVSRYIDVVSGNPVVQVNFGSPHKTDEEILSRLEASGQNKSPEVYQYAVTMLIPLDEAKKYRVGTTWNLSSAADGSVSIKPE